MTACAAIACDHCPKPGRCCVGFTINAPAANISHLPTALHALTGAASVGHLDMGKRQIGLPFLPLSVAADTGQWRWWCPILTREGRCGDHANRPQLCRTFLPGQDGLCVLHRPEPAAEG